jgi:carbamoyltransferase
MEGGARAAMGLTVLGISGGHDANWCVWRNGRILGAFEKERFTRRRHDTGAVEPLIGPSLRYPGLEAADIDVLATSEPVALGQTPGHTVIAGRRYERLNDWQWQVARCLGRMIPCLSLPHHLAHAAYARYTSPFAETAVLTLDGGGDWYTVDAKASTTVSSWRGSRLEWIERIDNSDFGSLWFGYSNAIFRHANAAGKLMDLAAFGTDRLVEVMRDRMLAPVRSVLRGAITVKDCWPDFDRPPFPSGLSLAAAVRAVTGRDRLALAGGGALNGYLTTAIAREAGFASTFVPPAVNDGGIAVGAALFAVYHELGWEFDSQASSDLAFLGMEYPPGRPAPRCGRRDSTASRSTSAKPPPRPPKCCPAVESSHGTKAGQSTGPRRSAIAQSCRRHLMTLSASALTARSSSVSHSGRRHRRYSPARQAATSTLTGHRLS